MAGTAWSNSTSTTGPITCTTRPTFSDAIFLLILATPRRRGAAAPRRLLHATCYVPWLIKSGGALAITPVAAARPPLKPPSRAAAASRRRRALRTLRARSRDHLDDLLRDGGLPHLVHVQGETVDHVARVAGGRVHGGHARAVLLRRRFQEGATGQVLAVLGVLPLVTLPLPRLTIVIHHHTL